MELRQLIYAVAVADHLHFRRAAEAANTAQPAISQQVRKLEQELGIDLFDRGRAGVRVTHAGALILARARRILSEVEALREEAAAARGLEFGRIELGAVQNIGPLDLPALIADFHRQHTGVDVSLREVSTQAMYSMVANDQLDLAIAALDVPVPAGLASRELLREPLVAIVPSGHRLSSRRVLRLEELAGEPFVAFAKGTGLRAAIERAAADAGFTATVHFETGEMTRVLALVAHGLGLALIPASTDHRERGDLMTVRLRPPVYRTVGVVWREDRSHAPAALAFLALALERLRTH
jgi:LysR family transcriptional activator of glutamate synthase operon